MTSEEELCIITGYELSGAQLWGVAITAGAMVGLVVVIGWWAIEKVQDWWYDRQDTGTQDTTADDPEIVEPYIPSVDRHMQVAKELIEDVEGNQVSSYGDHEERDPGTEG